MPALIDTDAVSERLRERTIDLQARRLRVTSFLGTEQAMDLSEPPNCNGFGRIRHFRRTTSPGWPHNPLPMDPACKVLGLPRTDLLRVQVFQKAACNWRCWYCFVPFSLLSANPKHSAWLESGELVDLYLNQPNPPVVIDLTGGQPDLAPEWLLWMMNELTARGLDRSIYLWSDDNLSNDYFWRYLTDRERSDIARFPNYGRVCCFKGFDDVSFSFNTRASSQLFNRQFELMRRLLELGIDIYAYATFTCPSVVGMRDRMAEFVDRLQHLDERLPLRTVPLEIQVFTPVVSRLDREREAALAHQRIAIEAWQRELERRFTSEDRTLNIADIRLERGRGPNCRTARTQRIGSS